MNNVISLPRTPFGRKVTVEDTRTGQNAGLQADGKIEPEVCDQVALDSENVRDFQESLETMGIKSLLKRVHRAGAKSLSTEQADELCKETLGESWRGKNYSVGADSRVTLSFHNNGGQHLKVVGNTPIIYLTTHKTDTEGRQWVQTVAGDLDSDFNLVRDSVWEQATVTNRAH